MKIDKVLKHFILIPAIVLAFSLTLTDCKKTYTEEETLTEGEKTKEEAEFKGDKSIIGEIKPLVYLRALDDAASKIPNAVFNPEYKEGMVEEIEKNLFKTIIDFYVETDNVKENYRWEYLIKYNKDNNLLNIVDITEHEIEIAEEKISDEKTKNGHSKILDIKVKIIEDIEFSSYDVDGKKEKLLLDLYLPDKDSLKPYPLIIYIHGGGWMEGDKENCPGEEVIKLGYSMASINYRLSDVASFPAQIHDVKEAVRWLRKNASKYNIDPDRFGVWGDSAGGHLSALLGTSAGIPELEGKEDNYDISSKIQAVCDWYGPTDFTKIKLAFEEKFSESVIEKYGNKPWFEYTLAITKLLGGPLAENLKLAELANPINFVDPTDPPFLIYHGELDNIVPISQSELLAEKLKENNVSVTFIKDLKRGHSYQGPKGERFDPALIEMVINFFDSVFKYNR